MLLNDQEIQALKLVSGGLPANFQPAGYDVSIAEIIDADGRKISQQSYKLRPQGIAWVVSTESVELPDNVLAYATIRTSLCNEGVLALNIGIVDPGWKGPISTAFINFGKNDFVLEKSEKFLRLSFHRTRTPPSMKNPVINDPSKYLKDVRQRARVNFGDTFLNLGDRLAKEQRQAAIKNLPLYGFAAAIFSIALTIVSLGFSHFSSWRAPTDIRQALENGNALNSYVIDGRAAERIAELEAALIRLECDRARHQETNNFDADLLAVATIQDCRAEEQE